MLGLLGDAAHASLAHRASFALATLATAHLGWRILMPPSPPQLTGKANLRDSISSAHSFFVLALYRNGLFVVGVWHALVALSPRPAASPLLPQLDNGFALDPRLFRWTGLTLLLYPLLCGTALLRLRAMGELGANFTFDLREPDKLNTSGLYRYAQHPSYTTAIVAAGGMTGWFMRVDGVLGTLLPAWSHRHHAAANLVGMVVAAMAMFSGIMFRVRDEEEMLRRKFGAEWEAWHMRTPRFIPFAPIVFRRPPQFSTTKRSE